MIDTPEPASSPPQTTTLSAPPRKTCLSRIGSFFTWLFMLVLSVALVLVALGAIAYYGFGYTLDTPGRLIRASNEIAAVRQENSTLQTQVTVMQTQAAQQSMRTSDNSELLDDVERNLDEIQRRSQEVEQLSNQLRENVSLAATIQSGARDDRVTVSVMATTQTERGQQITEILADVEDLQQQTERIARFLQRLSDISGDTVLDLENPNSEDADSLRSTDSTPAARPTGPSSPTLEPTMAATPTRTTTPAATATPAAAAPTPTGNTTIAAQT
jgi:ABC-type bacteriocin/lantibiotic exporter with double-glycine peptidase domain